MSTGCFLESGGVYTSFPPSNYVSAINDNGQMAGYYYDDHGQHASIRDSDGTYIFLPAMPEGGFQDLMVASPIDMNDAGQVLAWFRDGCIARVYDSGQYTLIKHPDSLTTSIWGSGNTGTCPAGINDQGQVVGTYYDGTIYRGFIAIPKPKTTTVLAISPNTPCCDQPVTFTATVAPVGGGSVPTGTVTFLDGTVELGVGNLENGTATFLGTLGLTGTHILTAIYGGDDQYASGTSPALTVAVPDPDFVITDIVLPTSTPVVDIPFDVSITVTNQGTAGGHGGSLNVWSNHPTAAECWEGPSASAEVGTLAVGESNTLTLTVTPSDLTSPKTLRASVDGHCGTTESDETNNQATRSYPVVAPDFVITDIVLPTSTPVVDIPFDVQITVTNQGMASGHGGSLNVWSDHATAADCWEGPDTQVDVGTLAVGESKTLILTVTPSDLTSPKTLRAFVDGYCQTTESDEANNQATRSYAVLSEAPPYTLTVAMSGSGTGTVGGGGTYPQGTIVTPTAVPADGSSFTGWMPTSCGAPFALIQDTLCSATFTRKQDLVCAGPPADLVAWWKAEGNANDSLGGHHGTLINGTAFSTGNVRHAFQFDGADDAVDVPDSDQWTLGTQDFTIDLWVNFDQIAGRSPFVGHNNGSGGQDKWIFWYDESGHTTPSGPALRFHINSDGPFGAIDTIHSPWSPIVGRWYHVAVTRQGSTYALFIDGSQVATATDQHDEIQDATAPVTIGWSEGYAFPGRIDEIDIFNRALSAEAIHAIFAAGSAGKCFSDTDADEIADASDNCPLIANADQTDTDGDDQGNACDSDDDNDTIPDAADNCPLIANPDQTDTNGDGVGDACAILAMTFDAQQKGTAFPFGATYSENGILATSYSNIAQFGDPLYTADTTPLYFHGPDEYIEFRRVDGGTFDLDSFYLVTNGFDGRWIETSKTTQRASLGQPTELTLLQFTGDEYVGISWFRIGTPTWATQIDTIRVRPQGANGCQTGPLTINGATFGPGTATRGSQTSIATQGSVMVQTGANVTFRAPFHRYRPGLRVATGAVFRAQTGVVACSAAARTPAAAAPSASASAAGAAVETAPPTAPLPFTGMDALPPWIQERLAARGIDRQAVAQALLDPQGQWLLFETPQGINPADRNGTSDIYRLDLLDERLALLSRAQSGAAGNGPSRYPAADALGDWVVFQSEANDLVSDDDNGVSDIFLHEVPFRTTRRLTATAADQASAHPALDAAGQDLLYDRQHRDGRRQIVADTLWGGVPAVPLGLTRDGTGIAVDSHHPAISADGRFVAYLTGKTGGGGTSTCRIHLGDRDSDRSEELPCPAEVEAASDAVRPNFSADGAQLQWYFPGEDIPVQVYNPLLTVPVGVVP